MKINKVDGVVNSQPKNNNSKLEKQALNQQYNQINEISNVCYKPISFGRSWAEHKSWGAVIDPKTKETSFKILTYPDTQRITVTVEKKGNKHDVREYELVNRGNGIFETENKIPSGEIEHGDSYYYTIYKGNGDIDKLKDPYSFRQKTLLDKSTIYDHSEFEWSDGDWYQNNKKRISRQANSSNKLTPVNALRIFEFNTATLTKKGTFNAAKNVIKSLPQMGYNAIEIMPVENTFSYNWGYDGVDKLAPSEFLGGPDGLKSLIDYAHEQGLNVIMDMVPNHLGPDGASLLRTGPFIQGQNCFGESFNFEGENSRYVRDFMVNAAINWLNNYHCDGLRLDMTKMMGSDSTMKQIAAEVNYHYPDAFLIAEDGRGGISVNGDNYWDNYDEVHDNRVVNPLYDNENTVGWDEGSHCHAIDKISSNQTSLARLGYDSEWDFYYFHNLKNALYGNVDIDAIDKALLGSQNKVKYVMSHDEIGNYEGSRLLAKLMVPMLHLNENVYLNEDDENRAKTMSQLKGKSYEEMRQTVVFQKAQFAAEKLAMLLQTGELDKYSAQNITNRAWYDSVQNAFKNEILTPLGISHNSEITYERVKAMFERSFEANKMALARTFATPGPKMVFQGDDSADLTPFRFFRQFESAGNEHSLYVEKGYQTGEEALNDSKMGTIKYSSEARSQMNKFRNLTRDLNKLNNENKALQNGHIVAKNTIKHPGSQVIGTHLASDDHSNELFVVTNFSQSKYPREHADKYYIHFPEGRWVEVLNTDDKKYDGQGRINSEMIYSDGKFAKPLNMAGLSTMVFKKV